MLLIYGDLMPVRLLEEIQFWKNQELEHAHMISQLVPELEPNYVQVLNEWEQVFQKTEETARGWLNSISNKRQPPDAPMIEQIELLLKASVYQSEQFVQQLEYMRQYSTAVQETQAASIMVSHIARESYVFVSLVHGLTNVPLASVSANPPKQGTGPQAHIHASSQPSSDHTPFTVNESYDSTISSPQTAAAVEAGIRAVIGSLTSQKGTFQQASDPSFYDYSQPNETWDSHSEASHAFPNASPSTVDRVVASGVHTEAAFTDPRSYVGYPMQAASPIEAMGYEQPYSTYGVSTAYVSPAAAINRSERVPSRYEMIQGYSRSESNEGGKSALTEVEQGGRPQPDLAYVPPGGHRLPPLAYAYNALEPYIDETTMRIHHDKHHQSYVDGLNKAELALVEARRTGNFDRIKALEGELSFHGAGHYLHTIFWEVMSPRGGGEPEGELRAQIVRDFGSLEAFKQQFSKAAETVEGSGWTILVWSPRSRRLEILQAEKHQNLSQWDVVPLLPIDVWEHAYYLKHQNKRPDYIKDWWNVVYWPKVHERYMKARELKWTPF